MIETAHTFSTPKAVLLAIILTAICSFPPYVSAIEFSFAAPDSVQVMEEFEVKIGAADTDIYDVKIFFKVDGAETRSSEIKVGDDWKSSYYYLKSSFPEQQTYYLRLKQHSSSNTDLCVRLRKPNQTSYAEECKDFEVTGEKLEPIKSLQESEVPVKNSEPPVQTAQFNNSPVIEEPIILRNSAPLPEKISTTQGKTRIIINYVLALVILLALFLLVKRRNSEF